MYGSVWNRVFLLATGMAFGWNLVHLFAASPERRKTVTARAYLGLGLGVVAVITLAVTGADAMVTGILVFLFSALVAYAGNAKQVSKTDKLLFPLPEIESSDKRELADKIGVLLVGDLLPQTYTGSQAWARAFALMKEQGQQPPRWFTRPQVYGRIRSHLTSGSPPIDQATLDRLCADTQAALGKRFVVQTASTLSDSEIADRLRGMVVRGVPQIIVAPLAPDTVSRESVQEEISRSRARDALVQGNHVQVRVTSPSDLRILPPCYGTLNRMLSGAKANDDPLWTDEQMQALRQLILARVR